MTGVQTCALPICVDFSGGEMQKLMLARALYKDAPVIILDEPTAALDPIAESEMYDKYAIFAENKTSIFISHRMSSCRFCDDIIVFDKGKIVERGRHDELLSEVISEAKNIKDPLVICSLGPTATVLAYDLSTKLSDIFKKICNDSEHHIFRAK